VQVGALVDETDIGKIRPKLPATVTVAAYPQRPFEGTVDKIEPQSVTEQNVTMFRVIVGVENREQMLRPGMSCEVEIHVGRRDGVLAIPNAALRTPEDVASAAGVLGVPEPDVGERRGDYLVFALRGDDGPTPVWVRTGLTDLDFSEVEEGLAPGDSVLILPSASLVRSQQQWKERVRRVFGGGLPGVRSKER
jgi:HlyD family secretion protein